MFWLVVKREKKSCPVEKLPENDTSIRCQDSMQKQNELIYKIKANMHKRPLLNILESTCSKCKT